MNDFLLHVGPVIAGPFVLLIFLAVWLPHVVRRHLKEQQP